MKNICVYPGSFNPFTIGHLNIFKKAENIFGKGNVIVSIGINPEKTSIEDMDRIKKRAEYISSKIDRKVEIYSTFLHEYVEDLEKNGDNVVVVRGLRNGDDLAYENNQLKFIQEFKPDIKSIFIMCDKEFEHISSTSMRQLESFKPGSSSKYIV